MTQTTVSNPERYALQRLINRYQIHSFSELSKVRDQMASNLLVDIIETDAYRKRRDRRNAQTRFQAHHTQMLPESK